MGIQDRASGALLGMAVGEALGAPLEGMSPEDIEQRVGPIEGYLDPAEYQPRHRSGYFTFKAYEDETQVALATAEVLISGGEFSVEMLRARLEELGAFVKGNVLGYYRRPRRNFRVALRRMLDGLPWTRCGVNTAGSGAASRGIPIGIWYRDDADERARVAIEATLLTHRDPRACAATVSVAEAVAAAMAADRAEDLHPGSVAQRIAEAARDAERLMERDFADVLYPGHEIFLSQFSSAAALLPDLVDLDIEPAFRRIVEHAADKGSRPITAATRGFSLTAVVSALYIWLTGLDSLEGCILDAICEGGSTDTLGCLAGGLSGALHGAEAIPARWRQDLKNADHVGAYGAALASDVGRSDLGPLVDMESRVTQPAPLPVRKRRIQQKPVRRDDRGSRGGRGGRPQRRGGGDPHRRGDGGGASRRDDRGGPDRGSDGGRGPADRSESGARRGNSDGAGRGRDGGGRRGHRPG